MLPQRTSAITALILLLLVAGIFSGFTIDKEKTYPYEKWTAEELAAANTAKDIRYLSAQEKEVIYYTNLARVNPKLFAETYAQQYIDTTKRTGNTASLISTLKKMSALPALKVDSVLCVTAADHAEAMGIKGSTGHAGSDKRMAKVKGRFKGNHWGENCSYGRPTPFSVVMQLLIDEGVSSLGHRKNILSPDYTHIGTSVHAHKKYGTSCVQNFGG